MSPQNYGSSVWDLVPKILGMDPTFLENFLTLVTYSVAK
jgi:hypothetical protein